MRLTLHTRPGCRLCDEMKAVIDRVRGQAACELTEVDISGDETLLRRYGHAVPVLLADGVEVARARIGVAELLEILARKAQQTVVEPRAASRPKGVGERRRPPDEA